MSESQYFYIRIPKLRVNIPKWQNIARHFVPNVGTCLVVAAIVFTGNAAARSNPAPSAPTSSTNTIPYQGRIANASGQAITGTQPMIFRLYNAASGGTHVWEEQWTGPNSVRVSDGLFNVMLGSLNGISQAIITGNPNLWLGITVGSDNEMTPRVQLGSVPFATQALTVPDGSVTTEKLADGSVTAAKLSNGSIARVLGQKSCVNCSSFNEVTPTGRYPAKGANINDLIEVTVTTTGRPLLIYVNTFLGFVPPVNATFCGVEIFQGNTSMGIFDVYGARMGPGGTIDATYCNGSIWVSHLPAGTYAFRVSVYVESNTTINWAFVRQISVVEY